MAERDIETMVLYGVVTPDGGPLTIVLGIPTGAWEYMSDGVMAHTVDLSDYGIPIKVVLYGGKDAAAVADRARVGPTTMDMRRKN